MKNALLIMLLLLVSSCTEQTNDARNSIDQDFDRSGSEMPINVIVHQTKQSLFVAYEKQTGINADKDLQGFSNWSET